LLLPNGEKVSDALAAECSEMLWSTIAEASQHSNEKSDEIPASESLFDYLSREIPPKFQKAAEISGESVAVEHKIDLTLRLAGIWGAYVGSEVAKQSRKLSRLGFRMVY
jgi:hypothetical protein